MIELFTLLVLYMKHFINHYNICLLSVYMDFSKGRHKYNCITKQILKKLQG